jgi:hypothetical protein
VRAAGLSNSDKPKTLHTTEAGLGEQDNAYRTI